MKPKKHLPLRRLAVVCAAVVLVFGLASICYAADIGGIRQTIQLWIRGNQMDAQLDFDPAKGSYTLSIPQADGSTLEMGGGGVAFDDNGGERPLTQQEVLEHLNKPQVEYRDDGTVWVYYLDQVQEVTHLFEDGVCYVKLEGGEKPLYMTIEEDGGYGVSQEGFPSPDPF